MGNDSQEVADQGETSKADALRYRNYVDYKQKPAQTGIQTRIDD
jgi:hypothetical protein